MSRQIYRLCLDDYSVPPYMSLSKEYFGTLEMIDSFIEAIRTDAAISEKYKNLISAYDKYKNGEKDVTHIVAYKEVRFLDKVRRLATSESLLSDYKWEHLNIWNGPYNLKFQEAKSEHLWLSFKGRYVRCIKTCLTDLQYENATGQYSSPEKLWGFPHQIEIEGRTAFNRLYVVEKFFETKQDALNDAMNFKNKLDTDFAEFFNDIFGDG